MLWAVNKMQADARVLRRFIGVNGSRTVLLNDRSGLGGVNRPVGDQGKKRPGSTEFDDLVHDEFYHSIVLASQAGNSGMEDFSV